MLENEFVLRFSADSTAAAVLAPSLAVRGRSVLLLCLTRPAGGKLLLSKGKQCVDARSFVRIRHEITRSFGGLMPFFFFPLASQTFSLFKEEGGEAVANSQDNSCPHFYGAGKP